MVNCIRFGVCLNPVIFQTGSIIGGGSRCLIRFIHRSCGHSKLSGGASFPVKSVHNSLSVISGISRFPSSKKGCPVSGRLESSNRPGKRDQLFPYPETTGNRRRQSDYRNTSTTICNHTRQAVANVEMSIDKPLPEKQLINTVGAISRLTVTLPHSFKYSVRDRGVILTLR